MTKEKKSLLEPWRQITKDYARLVIPNRPSTQDCENYGKLIKSALGNKKNPKILVLGSTPEIRSLLYTYTVLQGAQVICIDVNPAMYRAMTSFVTKTNLQEKFYRRNWLATGFPGNYFDLIMGDEIICNIPKKIHDNLFQEISRVLKDGCYFITRHNLYVPGRTTAKEIISRTVRDVDRGKHSFQTAINYLYITLFYQRVQRVAENRVNIIDEMKDINRAYRQTKNKRHKKIISTIIDLYRKNWGYFLIIIGMFYQKWPAKKNCGNFSLLKKLLMLRTI